MAVNKSPWLYNIHGAVEPLIKPMNAAAGSTRTFKRGEILTYNENTGVVTAVDAVADAAYSLVIAAEEQKSTDAARYVPCYMLRDGDVFEFTLAAAASVAYGNGLTLTASQSQQLTVDVDGVAVAVSVGTDNVPSVGTTLTSKSTVQCVFLKEYSYYYKNILQMNLKKVMAKTADYTLTMEDCGAFISNKGASGAVVITAPNAVVPVGWHVYLAAMADQNLSFDPKPDTASVYIKGAAQTAGKYVLVADIGDYMLLVWDGTDWLAFNSISGADGDITVEG